MGTIVSNAALAQLRTGLITQFADAYGEDRPLLYPQLTTPVNNPDKKNILLAIADMFPSMRQWIGDRVFNNPGEFSQLIENPHYELSMEIDADDVADNELGGYFLSAQGLADSAAESPEELLTTLIQSGQSKLGFDGQNFFDPAHPIDAVNHIGSQTNYESSGRALTAANFEVVRANMATWKAGPSQKLIGSTPTHVMVPTQLLGIAKRIFEAEYVGTIAGTATETNVNKGVVQIIHNPRLNNEATGWYALDLRKRLKPWVYATRQATKLVMLNRPNDQGMFLNNKIQFGVDGRFGVGLGVWFRAYKAVA